MPPHWPHWATVEPVGEVTVVEDDAEVEDEPEEAELELPVLAVPLKVVPMSPNLMLEKVTYAFGLWDSTSAGTPEVVAQVPRATPGEEADLSVG